MAETSRVAYISGAYDSLVTFVEGEQARRAASDNGISLREVSRRLRCHPFAAGHRQNRGGNEILRFAARFRD
jgi:hypothetical protein